MSKEEKGSKCKHGFYEKETCFKCQFISREKVIAALRIILKSENSFGFDASIRDLMKKVEGKS